MKLPIIIAGISTGIGVLALTLIARADAPRGPRALLAQGRFVRGLNMNRTTRDGRVTPHWGVDIAAPTGTPVYAVKSGRVIFSRPMRGYGNVVMLSHTDDRRSTLYAHLHRSLVSEGQSVRAGQQIAEVGGTRHGRNVRLDGQRYISVGPESAGAVSRPISPHVHFEVHPGSIPLVGSRPRRLDPVSWLQREGIGQYAQRWNTGRTHRVV